FLGALGAFALVAAACGTGGSPSPSLDMPTSIGEGEGELNLVIWAGYAEDGSAFPEFDWVTPFEEETGCIVNSTVQADSAAGVQLLRSGEYDGGSFSGNATDRLMAAGDVAPVNVDLLSNYANVFDGLKLQAHNSKDGVPYGVPHGRGPNLLIWNTDEVDEQTTWDGIWENAADHAGKLSIFDSQDFIADAAIHLMATQSDLGITNPYQLTQEQFDAAIALLEEQFTHEPQFWSGATFTEQIQAFAAGDVVIGTTWQFQVNSLLGADPPAPVKAIKPAEGTTGWSDTWMIASEAAHPNCMYMWMNHMMSAEANGQATVYFGEAPTSDEACAYAETIAPGHCELTHATDEAYYEDVWYWSTAREDCGDDDAATTCVDYDAWVEAWTTLRGG
ncbi:MAG TPA: extracellular solute-binding protein, partial [Candidatus Limnocylindrales bacterium]|nr:extracellular solute-binding protein [Candidatus Limnocylindrales bacterium]